MAPELGGYLFDCSLRDIIARNVFFAGCFANQEISLLRGVLQRGMTFVDVGANWGLFTMVARSLVGNEGLILALEPDPRMMSKLKSNLQRNRIEGVRLFEVAAADADGSSLLTAHDAEDNWGVSRLAQNSDGGAGFQVTSRRLDVLLDESEVQDVDLVKIDVEGAEDLVLDGMEIGLRRGRYGIILLELHPQRLAELSRSTGEVTDRLLASGYTGYALDGSREASRKAYYHPWRHFSEYVLPLERAMSELHPHTLWISPQRRDLM